MPAKKSQNNPKLFKGRRKKDVSLQQGRLPIVILLVISACSLIYSKSHYFVANPGLDANPQPNTDSSTKGVGGGVVAVVDSTIPHSESSNWCDKMKNARTDLNPSLAITYPCETMKPAVSAVVCMLTGAVDSNKANKILFTAREYIDGATALGVTLMENIDRSKTHQLLLLRDGFELAPEDVIRLEAVGWTIGTAPEFELLKEYTPTYERYKTTYTKVTTIGLAEYECALLMDADTLVVGDLRSLMTCDKFQKPRHRVAGTLDLDKGKWWGMNTGSVLWRTSSEEMERVFRLSRDETFMKRFSSDQDFLNHVYPERYNRTRNNEIIQGTDSAVDGADAEQVVDLTWDYNAQTHVEAERIDWWEERRPSVKILHFTRKKGWQCEERHDPPPPLDEMPTTCHLEKGGLRGGTQAPICYCREAHLYWNALSRARSLAAPKLTSS